MKTNDTETLGKQRAKLNKTKSKPNPVDRPVSTAHTIVHHYNGTQYCSTDSSANIPLPPDQRNISDVAKLS